VGGWRPHKQPLESSDLVFLQGIADGRVNLIGKMAAITDEQEKQAAKELYVKAHPGSFWVEFGDFRWAGKGAWEGQGDGQGWVAGQWAGSRQAGGWSFEHTAAYVSRHACPQPAAVPARIPRALPTCLRAHLHTYLLPIAHLPPCFSTCPLPALLPAASSGWRRL